jgi:hypothetical protein
MNVSEVTSRAPSAHLCSFSWLDVFTNRPGRVAVFNQGLWIGNWLDAKLVGNDGRKMKN